MWRQLGGVRTAVHGVATSWPPSIRIESRNDPCNDARAPALCIKYRAKESSLRTETLRSLKEIQMQTVAMMCKEPLSKYTDTLKPWLERHTIDYEPANYMKHLVEASVTLSLTTEAPSHCSWLSCDNKVLMVSPLTAICEMQNNCPAVIFLLISIMGLASYWEILGRVTKQIVLCPH